MTKRRSADPAAWRLQTRLVRGGTERSPHGETAEALYLTSGYVYDSAATAEARFANRAPGYVYGRFGNPTVTMFENRMALLETAGASGVAPGPPFAVACRATATGMAAVNAALMCQLKAGDSVVAARAMFGSCRYIIEDLLPRFGVAATLVDGTDLAQWRAAVKPATRCVFLETPANPTLEIVDIAAVAAIAHKAGAKLIVDNVFATPILQQPFRFGADIVVYSATKHIDGQGRCLGGAVLAEEKFVTGTLLPYLRHTGPSLSPFNAWVMLKGLETLELRLRRQVANAAVIADFLNSHKAVKRVIYPGLSSHPQHKLAKKQMSGAGSLLCIEIDGDKKRAFRVLDRLQLIDISNNLGDAKSLITHPATTTHQRLPADERARLGIHDNLVRLSVGLEDPADLIDDLSQALAGK
jgi:O-succinylhomoserine sulfhydrylase